jgi:hypothetical protein
MALMESFQALSGFREEESALFRDRLGFAASLLDPAVDSERFTRVVRVAGARDPRQLAPGLDVHQLLRVRDSDELQQFREWLSTIDAQPDEAIARQVNEYRSRLAAAFQGALGRGIRFVVTTGLSLHPELGHVLGGLASAMDVFLLDRIVGKPGPATFLGREYRSIFVDGDR